MANLVYCDTETTGLEEEDALIQLCYLHDEWEGPKSEYFMSLQPIKIEAKMIHHITEKDLEGKDFFEGSTYWTELNELLKNNVFVAHNARFDMRMLRKEKVEIGRYIDTLRVSKHVLSDISNFSLQYLRYYLEVPGKFNAHDAKDDVLLLACVFEKLRDEVEEKYNVSGDFCIDKMVELSQVPVKMNIVPFGKHKGKTFEKVNAEHKVYLKWLKGERKKSCQEQFYKKPEDRKPVTMEDEDLDYTLRCYIK